jgi:acyl CoA:acetate/3-ketoacid CoA transferase
MDKTVESAEAAVSDVPDGITLLVGGFGLCGNPENLIRALHTRRPLRQPGEPHPRPAHPRDGRHHARQQQRGRR